MSIQDSLFLVTELNKEEILQLFFEDTNVTIQTMGQPHFVIKYVEADNYTIQAFTPETWDVENCQEECGFVPNIELYFTYAKTQFYVATLQAWARIIQLLHKTEGDVLFTSNGSDELIRKDNRIKIRIDSGWWTPDRLQLLDLPYETFEIEKGANS